MLMVEQIEKLRDTNLNVVRRKTTKKQILLYDTQRKVEDFVNKLKYRNNGKYKDVPHYIISKLGKIYEVYDTNHYSITFEEPVLDKKLIKIAIENLGWLNKNTITGFLNNWIGDAYRSEPHVRGWRDHYFWDRYNDEQYKAIEELCRFLCEKHNIPYRAVPSQGYIESVSKFNGIACKSNYSNIYTDINPSFNFKIFTDDEKKDESI